MVATETTAAPTEEAVFSKLSGKTVILVDDESATLSFLSEALASAGLRVYTAENGQEAWDKLGRQGFTSMPLFVM